MQVYINGKDGGGWAIDMIRDDISSSLKRLEIKQTSNFLKADIIHNIWWNRILDLKYYHLRFKKNLLLTAVNFIDLEDENYFMKEKFHKANKFVTGWISPSTKQKRILEKYHENVYVLPYYLNYQMFNYTNYLNKKTEILKKYNIPENVVKDKIIIGSFQRDTDGSDLSKPKWQKGPELLIEILKDLPKDKYILLLASSRRHYVINECKKYGIPYYFVGKETNEDDIGFNNLPLEEVPALYSITDLYLVTSRTEGGPKAILEATAMKTFIYSTDVGFTSDFLNKENVFTIGNEYKKAVYNFVANYNSFEAKRKSDIEAQYLRSSVILNPQNLDNQLLDIYNHALKGTE